MSLFDMKFYVLEEIVILVCTRYISTVNLFDISISHASYIYKDFCFGGVKLKQVYTMVFND